jgi:hydrogenase maturation factor
MEIIEQITITKQQLEHVRNELQKLEEMEVCLSDKAIMCYKLFDIIRENVTIMYWVRIKVSRCTGEYILELIKEELTPIDFNLF